MTSSRPPADSSNLRAVLDALPDAVVVLSPVGVVLFANPAAARMFSSVSDDLIGCELGSPESMDSATPVELPGTEGVERELELHKASILWEGESAFVVTLRDVTDRIRARQLERRLAKNKRLASIGRVTAGVAHEVNNPASFILCNLELLRDQTDEDSEAYELIEDSIDGIRRISSIIDDLRVFSRTSDEDAESVRMADVVASAAKFLRAPLRTQAELHVALDHLPPIVGHRGKLIQVFVNLLSNALDALLEFEPDEKRIMVSGRVVGDALEVVVEDTGGGIASGVGNRVFEPFFTTKSAGRGTGLGLALCSEIVAGHGGTIGSAEGERGARFVIALPLDTGLEPSIPVAPSPPAPEGHRHRVLVVDDEANIRRSFSAILSRRFDTVSAADAEQAIALLRADRAFDVIICDLAMPGIGGQGLYDWLQREQPAMCDRVLFATGGAFTERTQAFLESLSQEVLTKPFGRDVLLEAVDRMVGQALSPAAASTPSPVPAGVSAPAKG